MNIPLMDEPMNTSLNRPFAAGLIFTLLLAAGPPIAASPSLKTASGEILLPSADGRSFVRQPSGEIVELPLPKGARVSDLRSVGGEWLVAAVSRAGGEPRIELLRGRGDRVETLAAPAAQPAAKLMQPVFVAGDAGFQALVWLAGSAHNQLAVKASRWLAGGWGPTETLSAPGPGTQIALSTAVLGDGSWLVVWAAYDGTDDEILWSRFAGGAWSKPRPIAENNAVPDITPSLFATAGGALAAWSRYDGNDYRINVSRFDGERWSAPAVAGPAGSTAPAFSDAERPYLVYRHADPAAWAVIELDDAGAAVREATVAVASPQRPMLATVTEQAVRFEWASRDRQMVSVPAAWVDR